MKRRAYITAYIALVLVLLCACSAVGLSGGTAPAEQPSVYPAEQIEPTEETKTQEEEPAPERPRVLSRERHESAEELERVTVQRALYEGGDELIFHFDETVRIWRVREYLDDGSERWGRRDHIIQTIVTIENSMGEFIQYIEVALPDFQVFSEAEYITPLVPTFFFDSIDRNIDINFDGYPDLVWGAGTRTRALWYYGWVWNPQLGRFDETSLREIPNMRIDEERQRIRGGSVSGGFSTEVIYKFEDGNFVLTNKLEMLPQAPFFAGDYRHGEVMFNYFIDRNGRYRTLREQHLENGEMVDTWSVITDTEEGYAIMREHLFGENSIWFPGQEW